MITYVYLFYNFYHIFLILWVHVVQILFFCVCVSPVFHVILFCIIKCNLLSLLLFLFCYFVVIWYTDQKISSYISEVVGDPLVEVLHSFFRRWELLFYLLVLEFLYQWECHLDHFLQVVKLETWHLLETPLFSTYGHVQLERIFFCVT